MRARLLSAFVISILWTSPVIAASNCLDLSQKGQFTFSGTLRHKIFAGPPNFEDVQKGDIPEPAYILELDTPNCARGDDAIADGTPFQAIHLFNPKNDAAIDKSLRRFTDVRVNVTGVDPFGAQTGHHHEPVVMKVVAISPKRDFTAGYGTAQTTVEAFYAALAAGDGDQASKLVIPRKRGRGHYTAAGITRFYGSLRQPLRLLHIAPISVNRYKVRYAFAGAGRPCDGHAIVSVENIDGLNLISAIHALSGC